MAVVGSIRLVIAAALLVPFLGFVPARADIAVVGVDAKAENVNGVTSVPKNPPPDGLQIFDLKQFPPRLVGSVDVPVGVAGPPEAIAVSADESLAIVASVSRIDPQKPDATMPDNRVSVVDLAARPPKVTQELAAGSGPSAVAISPNGALVLVANRFDGTVSIFALAAKRLEPLGKVEIGNAQSTPSGIVFTRDGRTALVARNGDNAVSLLRIDGTKVSVDKRQVTTGIRPYNVDLSPDGKLAAVSNMGRGEGDVDTVALIDLTKEPFRTVEQFSVPSNPEGLKFSPDGKFLAVGSQNGSQRAPTNEFYNAHGVLTLLAVKGHRLSRVAEAPVGRWSQGIAFSRDGKTILVENMVEKNLSLFRWEGAKLMPQPPIALKAGGASMGTARR